MCIKQACNLEESGTYDSKHKKNQLSEPEHKMTEIRDLTFYKLYKLDGFQIRFDTGYEKISA